MIDCRFKGHGYENIGAGKTPKDVIEGLKKSKAHNDVMLNSGMCAFAGESGPDAEKGKYWGSVGAAFLREPSKNDSESWHLSPLWFAKESDNSTC